MTDAPVDVPDLSAVRRIHRILEPFHASVYFAPERTEFYEPLGLNSASGYFASRSAALGEVPAQVVTATFFNFAPELVARALEGVWATTTVGEVLDARLRVADAALRTHLDADFLASKDLVRAAELARMTAVEATRYLEGRPLFAAHAALDWPTEPHLVLWHAATLLREFRGDGHVATLVTSGLDGLEALIIHAASRQIPETFLRITRGWTNEAWAAAIDLHRQTGWLAPGDPDEPIALSPDGQAQREAIEAATDRASTLPWLAVGDAGITELAALLEPWTGAMEDGMFGQFSV